MYCPKVERATALSFEPQTCVFLWFSILEARSLQSRKDVGYPRVPYMLMFVTKQ